MAFADLGEFVVASLRNYSPKFQDNILLNNALLNRLEKKGRIVRVPGGRTIDEALIYPTNGNGSIKWYQGYDSFTPPTSSEVLDAAEYQWKQFAGFISISGIEEIQNSGEWKNYDYADARIAALESLMRNAVGASLFSDGTGSGGKEIGGLKLLIADNPAAAGTVGGIDQVAFPFWRNQFTPAATLGPTTIRDAMNVMWLKCTRGTDRPDLLLADDIMYGYFETSLQEQQRFIKTDMANAGFAALQYKDADVVYDVNCTAKHMYFVNSDTLKMKAAPDRLFDVGKARVIQNADYKVIPAFFAGNLTCNQRNLNGVIIDD